MSFKILSILYTEFNIDKGPELVYQIPSNYITQEDFKKISEFVVPSTKFCHKEISLHLGNTYLLGFPIFLNNPSYERNRFEFNFCLLVEEEDYENNNYLYQCLIKKIDMTFENLEIDYNFKFMQKSLNMIKQFIDTLYSEFISGKSIINIQIEESEKRDSLNEDKLDENCPLSPKDSIGSISSKSDMPKVLVKSKETNDIKELTIQFSYSSNRTNFKNTLYKLEEKKAKKIINFQFRYINFNNGAIEIKNYFVPIWIKKIYMGEGNKLDFISLSIISKINGKNSVNDISKESTSVDLVKYILYSLYITGQIFFVDIFRDSNIYKPKKVLKDIKIEGLFNKFKEFYLLNQSNNNLKEEENINNIEDDINIKSIDDCLFFSYYVLLANSKNVKNFEEKVNNFDLDLQLFIAFGVYLGIIRRIHLYFVIKKVTNISETVSLMNGQHCEDDICLQKGITLEGLQKIYDKNKGGETSYFLYK